MEKRDNAEIKPISIMVKLENPNLSLAKRTICVFVTFFKTLWTLDTLTKTLVFYLPLSIALSLSIFFRFNGVCLEIAKLLNFLTYLATYYFVPLIATCYLVTKLKKMAKILAFVMLLLIIMFLALNHFSEYIFGWIFFLPLIMLYKSRGRFLNRKTLSCIFILIMIIPHITTFICYSAVLSQAEFIDEVDRIKLISDVVRNITAFGYPFRAYNDFWKFLLCGTGHCGEQGMAVVNFLNKVNFTARKASFPGENHEFVEVRFNNSWYIIDPGSYLSRILTRTERSADRINREVGAISYVIAYEGAAFVELTQEYVPTDTVIIRVTQHQEPLANVRVFLSHIFNGSERSLPVFYTNINGTIILHIGAMNYSSAAGICEQNYRIYVNEKDTGYRVSSSGTGKTQFIPIDLTYLS